LFINWNDGYNKNMPNPPLGLITAYTWESHIPPPILFRETPNMGQDVLAKKNDESRNFST
jgi:hypothetical protein